MRHKLIALTLLFTHALALAAPTRRQPGQIRFTDTTASTSTTTGSVTFDGGVGIEGALYGTSGNFSGNVTVGGTLGVTGATTLSSTLAVTSTATLGSSGSTVTHAINGGYLATFPTAGSTGTWTHYHSNNSNTASHARVLIQSGGALGGDPYIHWLVDGVTSWSAGIDNSDSDAWVLTNSSTLNGTNVLKIATSGAATLSSTLAVTGALTAGADSVLEHVIAGGPTYGKQLRVSSSGASAVLGTQYSNGAVFLAANGRQTANATDNWEQMNTGVGSMRIQMAPWHASYPGFALYHKAAGAAAGTDSTFWGAAVFRISNTGQIALHGGLNGTTTNDNAATGYVGELITSSVTTATNVPGATTVFGNLTSISLTAGDWDVDAMVVYSLNAATGVNFARAAVTTTSAGSGTLGDTLIDGPPPTSSYNSGLTIARKRFSVASTTTLYLTGATQYSSGNPQYVCRLSARRVR